MIHIRIFLFSKDLFYEANNKELKAYTFYTKKAYLSVVINPVIIFYLLRTTRNYGIY